MESAILEAREARWARRLIIADSMGADSALFTLTLRIPARLRSGGAYDERAMRLFEDLCAALEASGMVRALAEFRVGADGPEGYFVARAGARRAKELAVRFENEHPWGALADVDIMGPGGHTVGRSDLGLPPRNCLVCGGEAGPCVVERQHGIDELRARIEGIFSRPARPLDRKAP